MKKGDLIELNSHETRIVRLVREQHARLLKDGITSHVRARLIIEGATVNLENVRGALARENIHVFEEPDPENRGTAVLLRPIRPPRQESQDLSGKRDDETFEDFFKRMFR